MGKYKLIKGAYRVLCLHFTQRKIFRRFHTVPLPKMINLNKLETNLNNLKELVSWGLEFVSHLVFINPHSEFHDLQLKLKVDNNYIKSIIFTLFFFMVLRKILYLEMLNQS